MKGQDNECVRVGCYSYVARHMDRQILATGHHVFVAHRGDTQGKQVKQLAYSKTTFHCS